MKLGKTSAALKPRRPQLFLLILAYTAFVSLGLPDGLIGVAWPSMRAGFDLPLDALGLLLVSSMAGYLTASFFSGHLIARLGVGGVLWSSSLLSGAALVGYTLAPSWCLLALLAIPAGIGAGAIDAGMNTYMVSHHGEGLMQWLHASFGIGVALGPLIMTFSITSLQSWRPGYVAAGGFKLALALAFILTTNLWQRASQPSSTAAAPQGLMDYRTPLTSTLGQVGAWLSVLLFFLYTGLELSLGHWAYTLLTEARGIDPQAAGLWAGSYWAAFTLGRFSAGLVARKLGGRTLLRASLLLALIGVLLIWWNPSPFLSLLGVAVSGFALAPVFPALVSGTASRVGPQHAANTIGVQISAAGLGGALLPALTGNF